MLNEDRIKLMTKMAIYQEDHKEDIKISDYFKHDYIGLRLIGNILWVTIGFILILIVFALMNLEKIMDTLTLDWLVKTGVIVLGVYLIVILAYAVIGHFAYGRIHKKAKLGVREYYGNLRRLEREYRIEDANENSDYMYERR